MNKIVGKPLQLTTDPQLVIKVYVKIIEMKDQKGQITIFLCWMSNKVMGDLIEMWPKIDEDEFISTMFCELGYEMFISSDNILLVRNVTGLFEKNEIIRNIFITVEPEDRHILKILQ